MDLVSALAIVIGIMAGLATWVAVALGSAYFLIWAAFIAWASYYAAGGKTEGLQKSIAGNLWGIVCGVIALIVVQALGVTALIAGICVGVSVIVVVLGAKVPALSAIPASVFGYAATAALVLLGGSIGENAGAVALAAVGIAVSMIIGNGLGWASEKIAGSLVKS